MIDQRSSPEIEPIAQELARLPFFQKLSDQTVGWLAGQARMRLFHSGELVLLEGERSAGLYWLQTGWLKVVKQSMGGREQILRFIEAGQLFHEIGAFTDKPNPATVMALTDVKLWIIPQSAMVRLIREEGDFARHVIELLAARMQYLVSLVEDLSLRPVIGRLARLILDDAVDEQLQRPRWYTQSELAARLGTVPDVVRRTLRGLEADGLIVVQGRQLQIIDRRRLEEIAQA